MDENREYQKFSERLTAIRKEFEQNQIDLAERIRRYEELIKDIQTKGNEATKLGLSLKKYGLYTISQEYVSAPKEQADMVRESAPAYAGITINNTNILHEFIRSLSKRLEETLDSGWKDSSKKEEFLKEIKRTIQELVLKDYREKIRVSDFPKYLNRIVDIVIKKY